MPLSEIDLPLYAGDLPSAALQYIEAAKIQIDHFHYVRKGETIPAFVPSDFDATYRMIRAVKDGFLAAGNRFCEWGSGFGIAAGLAAMLGYESYGIEIHAELVHEAERLAEQFKLPVEFIAGSLVPPGGESLAQAIEFAWLTSAADDAYEVLGLDASDFDIIFAYPWPGEEQAIYDLFERFASTGALLITYHGVQGVRVQRKVHSKRRRRG